MIVSGHSQERQRLCHVRPKCAPLRSNRICRGAHFGRQCRTIFEMSKYTAFRCPEDLLELAKVKAKKDRRSLSNYIITLIEKDVQDMMSETQDPNGLQSQRRK